MVLTHFIGGEISDAGHKSLAQSAACAGFTHRDSLPSILGSVCRVAESQEGRNLLPKLPVKLTNVLNSKIKAPC